MTRLALTVPEAARELAVSETTVYRLAKAGDIPCRKVRGQWRIPRQALMDYLVRDPEKASTADQPNTVRPPRLDADADQDEIIGWMLVQLETMHETLAEWQARTIRRGIRIPR